MAILIDVRKLVVEIHAPHALQPFRNMPSPTWKYIQPLVPDCGHIKEFSKGWPKFFHRKTVQPEGKYAS
jgi:hypothetical protein